MTIQRDEGVESVQAFIGTIATIAMVIHFTFGCCAHPSHFTGDCNSCFVSAKAESKPCCHGGHEDHEHEGHSHSHASDVETACDGGVLLASHGESHSCEGCSCAATIIIKMATPTFFLSVTGVVTSIAEVPPRLPLSVSAAWLRPDQFAYSGLRPHSIFERFLI